MPFAVKVEECENGELKAPESIFAGDSLTVEVFPDEGYELKTLYINGQVAPSMLVNGKYTFIAEETDYALSAEFVRIVVSVSFSVGLEVTPVEEREEWFYGDDYAFSLEAAEGYTLSEDYKVFVGDREASKGDDGYWHVTLEKENEISADLLSVAKYTVSFNSAGGSEVASRQVEYGRKVSRPEDPMREGYLFVGWKFGEEDFDFDWIVTEDIVLTAVWKKAEVVSDENGNSGCGSEAAGTFAFAVILAAGYVAKKCRRRR